jgi:hypothetical protein
MTDTYYFIISSFIQTFPTAISFFWALTRIVINAPFMTIQALSNLF